MSMCTVRPRLSEQLGTESLYIENDRRGYQELGSDCEAYGLKKHGLTRPDYCVAIGFLCLLCT